MDRSRRQRLTLVATILGSTVVFLDATVVNVALPAISEGLHAGLAGQQWVVEAYLLALVSLLLVGGSLGDQFGRRRMFVAGLVGFGATSALCALAPSDEMLVAARALQGMAGALLVPGSLAIVAATFDGERRGAAVGTWTAWTGIATVLGPAGGGALIGALSWRAIFWVNIPLVVATVMLTLHAVEESSDPEAVPGIDWVGIALSAAGFGGPVFALIEQPTYGWSDPIVLVPLLAGLASLVLFVIWEARTAHPMLDLSLFRVRNFAVANVTTLFAYGGLMGGFFFIGLFLQQTAGYSPLEAGLATTPVSVILFVLSPRFGRFASGTGPRIPMTFGPLVAGVGLLLMLRVDADAAYLRDVFPAVVIFGLGLAGMVAPLTATVLDSVEERHVGIASGVNNGISRVAGLLAIAVLGAVISARFDAALDDQFAGARLGPPANSAIDSARSKPLGAAKTGGLAPAAARRVESGVNDASVAAFHLGVGLAGGLLIVGGVVSAVGIVDPRRRVVHVVSRAATAGDCGQGAGCEDAREAIPATAPAGEAA